MTSNAPASTLTADEYLAWEPEQAVKHEFHRGEVFAMAGGSPRHNALCAALLRDLGVALRGGECRAFASDQRVSLRPREHYVYPDVSVVCGRVRLEDGTRDVVTNPTLIAEVISESTERYDRGDKWEGYRHLGTLDDYLLVSQRAPAIEHYQRQPDGSWRFTVARAGAQVRLSRGVLLDVDSVYDGVLDLPGDDDAADRSARG